MCLNKIFTKKHYTCFSSIIKRELGPVAGQFLKGTEMSY